MSWFDSKRKYQLAYRLVVGRLPLKQLTEVRILTGQPSPASSADRMLPCEGSGHWFDSNAGRQINALRRSLLLPEHRSVSRVISLRNSADQNAALRKQMTGVRFSPGTPRFLTQSAKGCGCKPHVGQFDSDRNLQMLL